jgi:hypothetical protein
MLPAPRTAADHSRLRHAELGLRAALRTYREIVSASRGTAERDVAAVGVVQHALSLCKVANEAALATLHGGREPWSSGSLTTPPRPANAQDALRLLKVAEVALDDDEVRAIVRETMGRQRVALHATDDEVGQSLAGVSAASVETQSARFLSVWPYAITEFNTASVHYHLGDFKRARLHSDRGMALLASTDVNPGLLVSCALGATGGSLPVARQLVVAVVSHACIARRVAVDAAPRTRSAGLAGALAVAELGSKLSRELDDASVAVAAGILADGAHKATATWAPADVMDWPGLLVGKTAVPLLRAFALYNHGIVAADCGHLADAARLLGLALKCSVVGLSGEDAFVRLVRQRLASLQSQGTPGSKQHHHCAASAEASRLRPRLVVDRNLSDLRAAHGVQTQQRRMGAPAPRPSTPAAPVRRMQASAAVEGSWIDDLTESSRTPYL